MKKIFFIISIGIIILIGIIGLSYNSNNKNTFTQDGVTYALTLDGASVNNFPSKGMYRIDVECTNATGKWLYDEWKLAVENINGTNATCDVNFVTIDKTYLNNYIIGLSGSIQGDGQVVSENGYRYEGKNPNNYVWFNNELWRIIGVFDSTSHGQSGQNLVKIIRANSIGVLAWDKSYTNDWTASSLMNLLNGSYLNAQDGTDSGYCYRLAVQNLPSILTNCDYTNVGVKVTYRNMIANVKWHLPSVEHSSIIPDSSTGDINTTIDEFYMYEIESVESSKYPTEWEGKIGLMYSSDYGYSVLASNCARTTYLEDYDSSTCAGESWLYGEGYESTITTVAYSGSIVYLDYSGEFSTNMSGFGNSTRPVLYLDSSVYVIDGNGTMADPYIIGM